MPAEDGIRAGPSRHAGTPRAGRPVVALLAAAGLAALLGSSDAAAQQGFLQVGWQQQDVQGLIRRGDSTVAETTFTVKRWLQNYVLNQSLGWSPGSNFAWQLGYQDERTVDRDQRVQVPYGHARLTLPRLGVYASMRPVTTTSEVQLGSVSTVPVDSIPATAVQVRTTQSIVSGYLAFPSLPRLDLAWTRDHRGPSLLGASSVGDRRSARLTHLAGPLSLRAHYGDLARGEKSLAVSPYQRNYGLGAGTSFAPWRSATLQLDYDFDGFRRTLERIPNTGTDQHRAALSGAWAQSRAVNWSLSAWLQRTAYQRASGRSTTEGAEAQLYGMFALAPRVHLQTGGQVRRVGDGQRGWERLALASATWDGQPRPGWRGLVNASQLWNWNPFRTSYGVSSLRGQSSMRLRTGVDLTGDLQATANNDTIVAARAVVQGSGGLNLQPLRTVLVVLRTSFYRVGSGFGAFSNRVGTGQVDVRWNPAPRLELQGSVRGQTSGRLGEFGSRTRSAYANWSPSGLSRLGVTWSRTDFDNPVGLANSLRTRREAVTAQTVWGFDRTKQTTLEAGMLDPGTDHEARTYSATFTWRFGR